MTHPGVHSSPAAPREDNLQSNSSIRKNNPAAERQAFFGSIALCFFFLFMFGCSGSTANPVSLLTSTDAIERTTEKGPVKLVVTVSPREPRLSDLVEMDLTVTSTKDVEIKPPAFGKAVGDFVVRDYSEKGDTSGNSGDTQTRRFVYKLEPAHAGRHLIRAMTVDFVDNRPTSEQKGVASYVESEPIEVNVTSELGDGVPNLADLEPMLPPRPLEPTSYRWYWLIGASVIAIAGLSLFWFRRRKTSSAAAVYQPTPEEVAHAAFAALLAEDLPTKGLFKEFYLRLTNIVRHYIEGTTGVRAPELTTEEFLRAMRTRDVFSAERSVRLKEFLEAADMVKYAGQQPDREQIELSIARAREFVAYQAAPVPVPELTSTTGS